MMNDTTPPALTDDDLAMFRAGYRYLLDEHPGLIADCDQNAASMVNLWGSTVRERIEHATPKLRVQHSKLKALGAGTDIACCDTHRAQRADLFHDFMVLCGAIHVALLSRR